MSTGEGVFEETVTYKFIQQSIDKFIVFEDSIHSSWFFILTPLKDPKRANLTFYGTLNKDLLINWGEHMYENYLKNLQKALKLIELPDIEVEEMHPEALKIDQ